MKYNSETMLKYDRSGNSINNAIPLGNGKLGALVCGGTRRERIFLNHDELWSGFPRETANGDKSAVYRKMRELAYEGKLGEVDDLIERDFTDRDVQCYLPLGTLSIETKLENVSNYSRTLDLENGVACVSFDDGKRRFRREYFTSFPDNVFAIRCRCSKKFDLTAGFLTELRAETSASFETIIADGICPSDSYRNEEPFVYSEKDEEKGVSFRFVLKVVSDGKILPLRKRIRVEGARSVVLVCAVETSFNGPFAHPFLEGKEFKNAALSLAENAAEKGFEKLLERHLADYCPLWGRMGFTLNSPKTSLTTEKRLLEHYRGKKDSGLYPLLFNFQRYLSISASRPGSRCMNLQGIWNTEMKAPWSSNYTVNINTEMNYWPQARSNLLETTEPFIDLVDALRLRGEKTAKNRYGARGSTCHHNTDIWAQTTPVRGCAVWLFWPCALGWMASQAWDIYNYSGDKKALKEKIFPSMTAAARFFLDVLTDDGEGHLIFAPSTSPENEFIFEGRDTASSLTTAMTMEIIAQLFADVKSAFEVMRGEGEKIDEALLSEIEDAIPSLLPIRLTDDGRIFEWFEDPEEKDPHHRHLSPLYALFPAHLIDVKKTPLLAEACRKFLERRGDEGTGWSLAWKINFWALLGDGERALKLLDMQLKPKGMPGAPKEGGGTFPNMFDAHPPFQIDGNFGSGSGILNMLVREDDEGVGFLPALPAEWENGEVKGLRLRGGKTADFSWKNGKLISHFIKSE